MMTSSHVTQPPPKSPGPGRKQASNKGKSNAQALPKPAPPTQAPPSILQMDPAMANLEQKLPMTSSSKSLAG